MRAIPPAPPTLVERLGAPFQRFFAIEAASTILLLAATAVALAWANSPWRSSYQWLWSLPLGVRLGGGELALSLEHWVNDGLMVLFFFLVGMEIKQELVHGELSSRDRAMLPVFGALGGMLAPAAIFAALHHGGPAASGWGVPMATDIAFAVAALAVLGTRVPPGLKVFLLALAIVDDLGSIAVIAMFYAEKISFGAVAAAAAGLAGVYALNRAGVRGYAVYVAAGFAVWLATLASGIHATVAGVCLGFLTPAVAPAPGEGIVQRGRKLAEELLERLELDDPVEPKRVIAGFTRLRRESMSPLEALTAALHPWVAFAVMPIFALANAGVPLQPGALRDPLASRVTLAVAAGLLVGKPLGIAACAWISVRLGLARLPAGVTWRAVVGAGALGGIGFTMAIFVTTLAFKEPALIAASKVGVLVASVLSAGAGLLVLSRALPPARAPDSSHL